MLDAFTLTGTWEGNNRELWLKANALFDAAATLNIDTATLVIDDAVQLTSNSHQIGALRFGVNGQLTALDNMNIEGAITAVAGGASLTEGLKSVAFFPSAAINMVAVGEESGQMEKALYKIASSYERQTDQVIRAITSLLEPALIVLIGAVIGFIVVAMLLPIFQMNLIIQ